MHPPVGYFITLISQIDDYRVTYLKYSENIPPIHARHVTRANDGRGRIEMAGRCSRQKLIFPILHALSLSRYGYRYFARRFIRGGGLEASGGVAQADLQLESARFQSLIVKKDFYRRS